MNTHKQSPILQWLKEERKALLCGVLVAVIVSIVNVGVFQFQGLLIGQWKKVNVPAATTQTETVMTPAQRRKLVRLQRLVRRLALRQKSAQEVAIGIPKAVFHPAPMPVAQKTRVAEGPVTDPSVPAVSPPVKHPPRVPSSSSAPASSVSSSSSLSLRAGPSDACAPFINAVFPVSSVPNWGAMRSPDVWTLDYAQMPRDLFVPVPRFDLKQLTIPRKTLTGPPIPDENIPTLTAKLFYSTRFFARYDIDSGEFEAIHPGMDLKLASGTPIGAVAGGTVTFVGTNARLGNYVIIRHCAPDGDYFSIYAHFASAAVQEGQIVTPGKTVGYVGMTGSTSAPHLHLQIDRALEGELSTHTPYYPDHVPSRSEADRYTVHPVSFIGSH